MTTSFNSKCFSLPALKLSKSSYYVSCVIRVSSAYHAAFSSAFSERLMETENCHPSQQLLLVSHEQHQTTRYPRISAPDNDTRPTITVLSVWTLFLSYASLACIFTVAIRDMRPVFEARIALGGLLVISIISLLAAMSHVGSHPTHTVEFLIEQNTDLDFT